MKKTVLLLTSINTKILKLYLIFLKKILKKSNLTFAELNIPTKKHKISLLKSPHVYKKSWEHFQIKKYKKRLILYNIESIKKNNIIFFFLKNKVKNVSLKVQFVK